jgi:hypothetical protein
MVFPLFLGFYNFRLGIWHTFVWGVIVPLRLRTWRVFVWEVGKTSKDYMHLFQKQQDFEHGTKKNERFLVARF